MFYILHVLFFHPHTKTLSPPKRGRTGVEMIMWTKKNNNKWGLRGNCLIILLNSEDVCFIQKTHMQQLAKTALLNNPLKSELLLVYSRGSIVWTNFLLFVSVKLAQILWSPLAISFQLWSCFFKPKQLLEWQQFMLGWSKCHCDEKKIFITKFALV